MLLFSACTSSSAAETDTQSVPAVSETTAAQTEVTAAAQTHDVILHNQTGLDIVSVTVKNDSGYEYSSEETVSNEDISLPVSGDGAFRVFLKFDGGKSLIIFAENDDDIESKAIALDEKGLPVATPLGAAEPEESTVTESETVTATEALTELTEKQTEELPSETVPTETESDPDRGCIGDEGLFN